MAEVVWGNKTLVDSGQTLQKINIRRLLMAAPNIVADSRTSTVIKFCGNKYVIKHSRRKVKNKKVYRMFTLMLRAYGALVRKVYPSAQFKVVCDETNNTPQDKQDGVLHVDVHLHSLCAPQEMITATLALGCVDEVSDYTKEQHDGRVREMLLRQ